MNSSTGIPMVDTALRVVDRFECEQIYLFELIDELRPDTGSEPRWNVANRAVLIREARRSIERLNGLVFRLRSLQQQAEPDLHHRLDAALFAAEISVDTAGVAVDQLCQTSIDWNPELPSTPWTH